MSDHYLGCNRERVCVCCVSAIQEQRAEVRISNNLLLSWGTIHPSGAPAWIPPDGLKRCCALQNWLRHILPYLPLLFGGEGDLSSLLTCPLVMTIVHHALSAAAPLKLMSLACPELISIRPTESWTRATAGKLKMHHVIHLLHVSEHKETTENKSSQSEMMTFLSGQAPGCDSAMIYLTGKEKKGCKLDIYLQESAMQIWSLLTKGSFFFFWPPHTLQGRSEDRFDFSFSSAHQWSIKWYLLTCWQF